MATSTGDGQVGGAVARGFCHCGCGEATAIAKRTNAKLGHVKGEPVMYRVGHGNRLQAPSPNPSGICQCGCGTPTPLARASDRRRGMVAGEHTRFAHGHSGTQRTRYLVCDHGYRTACWIWQLACDKDGYGNLAVGRTSVKAHRAMYEERFGPLHKDVHLHHRCEIPACVNPDHLEPLTPARHKQMHARLTQADVHAMRQERASGALLADLAIRWEVSESAVSAICLRKRWASV